MKKILFFTLFLIAFQFSKAQTARDVAVETYAEAKAGGGVYVKWIPDNTAVKYYIYKRFSSRMDWLLLDSVSGTTNSYLDKGLLSGQIAEYRVAKSKTTFSFYANGYLLAGFELPAKTNLGKVLMIIDSNYSIPLKTKIAEYKDQLNREGYTVISKVVLRSEKISNIKSWILNQWQADSFNVKSIFLLGHIPVPYSGNYRPDGHSDHTGAWPADVYYGVLNTTWSDSKVNNTTATRSENKNVPSDGKMDTSRINPVGTQYSAIKRVQIPVGRVDMYGMTSFGNDTFLTLRYLNKALNFRRGIFKATPRGLIDDNFGYFGSEAFASGGFRNFSVQFKDSVFERDYRTSMSKNSYLMSYGCGAGTYTSCDQVSTSANFVTDSLLNPFTLTFGSYYGDWDNTDNFLRAPLASRGWGLASVWSGRPYWMMHECALGLPLAQATLTSVNSYYYYNAAGFQSGVHTALMGDPTLTLYPLAALNNAKAIAKCTDKVRFRWDLHEANVDTIVIDEWVGGSWKTLVKTVGSDTDLTYKVPTGNHRFSIRPLKLMKSASGSWWQYGARQYTEVSVNIKAVAMAITSTKTACSGDSVIVAELKFGSNPKYTRAWFVNGKISADTSVSFKRTYAAGDISVKMQLTTDSGCVFVDSVQFTIYNNPTAKSKVLSKNQLCLKEKFNAITQSAGKQLWTIGKDTISKSDTLKYTGTTTGTFVLKHLVVNVYGCSDISRDTLVVNGTPNVDIVRSPDTAICHGGTFVFSAADTSNNLRWKLRFALKDSFVMNAKSVTITNDCSLVMYATSNAGCKDSAYKTTLYHEQPKKLAIKIVKPAVYPGDTIVIAVNPNATWPKSCHAEWSKPFTSQDSTLKFRVSDTGLLVFVVKNVNAAGCQSDTTYYAQYFGPSATKYLNVEQLVVYPNPNIGSFSLRITSEIQSIQVVNLKGQQIGFHWKESGVKNQLELHLNESNSGLYLIQGQYKNGTRFVSKFVVK